MVRDILVVNNRGKVLGEQRLLSPRGNPNGSSWYFFWCTYDDLEDVKTIYTGIAMSNVKPINWVCRINLNTVQDHHAENNINKWIAKIFNVASFDKIIRNYDSEGKASFTDRATFILMTNLGKLPCVESVYSLNEDQVREQGLDKLDFSKIVAPKITKEEIINAEISGDCMLRTLKAHGLTVNDLPETHSMSPKFIGKVKNLGPITDIREGKDKKEEE